jgi:parallel beta-helix repeat protein
MLNVVSAPYNADNTGVASCYQAFMDVITQAIANGGDEIYFPPGTYKIKGSCSAITPVYQSGIDKIKFYGDGAVIVCDTDTDLIAMDINNGAGGGFALLGDRMIFDGLTFQGFVVPIGCTTYGNGRLIRIVGNQNIFRNCKFLDGNGGAIQLQGDYNIIANNFFERCNNFPPVENSVAEFGAIQISRPSKFNTISENKITDHFYSGVCGFGDLVNEGVTDLDIVNNYIRSNSSDQNINHSMGIFLLNGANTRIKIIGNTIEKSDAEGIIIESNENFPAKQCVIADNIIRNGDFAGISLQSTEDQSNATFTDFLITGNVIENDCHAPDDVNQIWLDRVNNSIIAHNSCTGYKSESTHIGRGITFNNDCTGNHVSNNQVRSFIRGINFTSHQGALKDNLVTDCEEGILVTQSDGSSITGNVVSNCTETGINFASDSGQLLVSGNVITDCETGMQHGNVSAASNTIGNVLKDCTTGIVHTSVSSPITNVGNIHSLGNALYDCTTRYSGPVVPGVLTQAGVSGSMFTTTDTLVSGQCVVTFHHVYSGDRFLVLPANESGSGSGAMYIALIDTINNRVTVNSTDPLDNRDFVLLKMVSGG